MRIPSFDLPVDEIRRSLAGLRRPLSIAILRARNPFNVGAIIRVAHSFLAREILLIRQRALLPARFDGDGALREHRQHRHRRGVPGARARARQKLVVFEKDEAKVNLWRAELPEDCVMVFASEVSGVSPRQSSPPRSGVSHPDVRINHSFPVTVAAGIAMAEWTRRFHPGP